jgi:hypothetical protein
MAVTPAHPNDVLVTFEYAPNGLDWARLRDVRLLRWVVDESGPLDAPRPIVSGMLPPLAVNTDPVRSPQWAVFYNPMVGIPNEWRGNLSDFLTWLATNAGAHRQLEKQMSGEGGLLLRGLPWGADACSITI